MVRKRGLLATGLSRHSTFETDTRGLLAVWGAFFFCLIFRSSKYDRLFFDGVVLNNRLWDYLLFGQRLNARLFSLFSSFSCEKLLS